jgi:prephenate dehydrogenase
MTKVVSVYGYGRFGKLWADILSEDFKVKVYSRRGLKAEEVSPGIEITTIDSIFDCDAMFFCVAISSFEQVLIESKNYFRANTVYFDTCSVKVYPAQWMNENIPATNQIIATHPMFGPDSYYNATSPLPLAFCNVRSNEDVFKSWAKYFSHKKMRVEIMSAEEHDEMVAYSQGITHYVGRVLADLQLQPSRIDTMGYGKLLDIIAQTCNDTWQLFIDLQRFNPYTSNMREDLQNSLEKIYAILNQIVNGNGKHSDLSQEEWELRYKNKILGSKEE